MIFERSLRLDVHPPTACVFFFTPPILLLVVAARKNIRLALNKTDVCDIQKYLLHSKKQKIRCSLRSQDISRDRWFSLRWIGWIHNCSIGCVDGAKWDQTIKRKKIYIYFVSFIYLFKKKI